MKRRLVPIFAILAVVLIVAALILLMQPRRPPAAASAGLPEANALEPVQAEMACVDRVLANRGMKAEDVRPALDRCRGAGGGQAEVNSSR